MKVPNGLATYGTPAADQISLTEPAGIVPANPKDAPAVPPTRLRIILLLPPAICGEIVLAVKPNSRIGKVPFEFNLKVLKLSAPVVLVNVMIPSVPPSFNLAPDVNP